MLYLDKVKLPVPVRFRKTNGESHVMKLPVFQMFPVSGIKIENCFVSHQKDEMINTINF